MGIAKLCVSSSICHLSRDRPASQDGLDVSLPGQSGTVPGLPIEGTLIHELDFSGWSS